jgi:hypothetical protein
MKEVEYSEFETIDLSSTSTQNSRNSTLNITAGRLSRPEISDTLLQNKREMIEGTFDEKSDSDVEIIEENSQQESMLVDSVPKRTHKTTPLSEKVFKAVETAKSPLSIAEIHEKVGKTYDKKMIEKILQEQVQQKRLIAKTFGKFVIYCINNKMRDESVSGKSIFRVQNWINLMLNFADPKRHEGLRREDPKIPAEGKQKAETNRRHRGTTEERGQRPCSVNRFTSSTAQRVNRHRKQTAITSR